VQRSDNAKIFSLEFLYPPKYLELTFKIICLLGSQRELTILVKTFCGELVKINILVCSLRRINSDSFHNLLDQLSPKKYFIDKLTNCLPVHVSKPLLDKHSIKMYFLKIFINIF